MNPAGAVDYDREARRWRLRRGLLDVTVMGASESVLALEYGAARMRGLSIYEPLLAGALFSGTEMIARGTSVRLTAFAPSSDPSVTPADLDDPKQSIFQVREVTGALEWRYRSLSGLPMGSVLLALDFEPGGVWETEDGAVRAVRGQSFHLKEGRGRMRYGRDCVELGLGPVSEGSRRLRDAPPAPEYVRVFVAFETPADDCMSVKTYQESTGAWRR